MTLSPILGQLSKKQFCFQKALLLLILEVFLILLASIKQNILKNYNCEKKNHEFIYFDNITNIQIDNLVTIRLVRELKSEKNQIC